MAVVAKFAESFIEDVFKGVHDLISDVIKIGLLNTSYVFDPETDTDFDGVGGLGTNYQITSAGGYAAIELTDVAVAATVTSSDGVIAITCTNNPTWTATGAAMDATKAACIYNDTVSPKKIIMVIDFGATYTTADTKLFRVDMSAGVATAAITI